MLIKWFHEFSNSPKFIYVTRKNKSFLFINCLFIWLKNLWKLGFLNSWSHVVNSSQVLFFISSFKIKTTNSSWLFFLCFSTSYWISFDWSTNCFESTFWLDISWSIWKKWIWKLYWFWFFMNFFILWGVDTILGYKYRLVTYGYFRLISLSAPASYTQSFLWKYLKNIKRIERSDFRKDRNYC